MGQGLHTKLIQVASKALNVPISKIHINGSDSVGTPNGVSTGGSVGTDIHGPAVLQACKKLNHRLQKYKSENPSGKWEDWVTAAWMDCVCLVAYGHYDNIHDIGYDFRSNSGKQYHYFTYGAGAVRVEIDCFTGDLSVVKADLVMDLGKPINPALDVGQIEGGFVQGLGYMTTEQLLRSTDNGQMLSLGAGDYKVPNISDLPLTMNVALLDHSNGPPTSACYSSKGVGEPPFVLATGIPSAARMAISSYRSDLGFEKEWINLNPPLTPRKLSLLCQGGPNQTPPAGPKGTVET